MRVAEIKLEMPASIRKCTVGYPDGTIVTYVNVKGDDSDAIQEESGRKVCKTD
jgi:hypothetical protein